jgi:hypothetical protein
MEKKIDLRIKKRETQGFLVSPERSEGETVNGSLGVIPLRSITPREGIRSAHTLYLYFSNVSS